jgi:hypothetical protein
MCGEREGRALLLNTSITVYHSIPVRSINIGQCPFGKGDCQQMSTYLLYIYIYIDCVRDENKHF